MGKIERIRKLIELISKYNHHYYVLDESIISDGDYDLLYDELMSLENETGVVLPHSPTNKVGDVILKGFKKHTHLNKLYSLDKCNNFNNLNSWINSINNKYGKQEYSLEYKFDGLRVTLTYENGKLVAAATRGNGYVGEDVTAQILTIQNIPYQIDFKDKLVVEGEATMRLSVLKEYNKNATEPLKNARNAAAGAIRNLDLRVTASRNLDVYFYGVVYIENKVFENHKQLLSFLKTCGFTTYDYIKFESDFENIKSLIQNANTDKKHLDVLTDGIVIKVNDFSVREKLGYTAKFPKWAIAYKFEAQELTSTLKKVEWQVGRTGKITPIAIIEPIELAGATVKRATLNNYGDILRKGVKLNSKVFVRRSNEVIPEILKVASCDDSCVDILKPEICPSCSQPLTETGANLFCYNYISCPHQVEERIIHFCSRNAMNIEGISSKTAKLFRQKLNVNSVADLYKLKKEDLLNLDSFKDKKSENIINSIKKSKNVNFANFIYALGIFGVGEKTAKDIANNFNNLQDFIDAKYEDLIKVEEIGEVIANNILEFFNNDNQKTLINELLNLGVNIVYPLKELEFNENFTNKTIVLTGDLENFTRQQLTLLLENFAAKVTSSVSNKTDLVIVGKNAGSKLDKATQLNIKLMYEEELLNVLNN